MSGAAREVDAAAELAATARRLAHDMNNLLTVIALNIELASDLLGEDHPAMTMLNPALKAAHRSADLAAELLAAARSAQS